MTDWTPRQIEILRAMWGSNSPRDIGRCLGTRQKLAEDVRAKAKELGLPPCREWRSEKGKMTIINKRYRTPIALDDQMLEFAPGHICSRETYTLIERARAC